ncbi:hypothetical protein AgCh_005768 [Apium graveolens]
MWYCGGSLKLLFSESCPRITLGGRDCFLAQGWLVVKSKVCPKAFIFFACLSLSVVSLFIVIFLDVFSIIKEPVSQLQACVDLRKK